MLFDYTLKLLHMKSADSGLPKSVLGKDKYLSCETFCLLALAFQKKGFSMAKSLLSDFCTQMV